MDWLKNLYQQYLQSDIPAASLLRGDTSEFLPSVNRNLNENLSLLSTPEGAMDLVNPMAKVGGLLGTVTKKITPQMLEEFNVLAKEGTLRQARNHTQELKDLKSGKSDIAELNWNPDLPMDAKKIDKLIDEGYILHESWKFRPNDVDDYMIAFRNEDAIKQYDKASKLHNPYAFGSLYGYPEKDIANFYSLFRSPAEFYTDKKLWFKD